MSLSAISSAMLFRLFPIIARGDNLPRWFLKPWWKLFQVSSLLFPPSGNLPAIVCWNATRDDDLARLFEARGGVRKGVPFEFDEFVVGQ